MALARLAFRNLQQRVPSTSSSLMSHGLIGDRTLSNGTKYIQRQRWACEVLKRFSDVAGEKSTDDHKSSQGGEVAVSEGGDKIKSKLFPKRKRRRGLLRHWKDRDDHDFIVPALYEFFPSGLGNALLMQASENVSRLLKNLAPSHRVKEHDERYVLRFPVPGLAKEDLKITVEDGLLIIRGEHKEEDHQEGSDDEYGTLRNYAYYDSTLVLPDDAKADEIKAELKHGVLTITIPRSEEKKKDVKEVQIN